MWQSAKHGTQCAEGQPLPWALCQGQRRPVLHATYGRKGLRFCSLKCCPVLSPSLCVNPMEDRISFALGVLEPLSVTP